MGFARKSEFAVLKEQTLDSITFRLKANETTLAQYPFHASDLLIPIRSRREPQNNHHCKNDDTQSMIFPVGGHRALTCPRMKIRSLYGLLPRFDCEKPAKAIVMSPPAIPTMGHRRLPLEGGTTLLCVITYLITMQSSCRICPKL